MDDTNTSNIRSLDLNTLNEISTVQNVKQETYRPLGAKEQEEKEKSDPEKRESMVRDNADHDGADEKMLAAGDGERLAEKELEVKFISGSKNGDAQIDIENVDKAALTGLTKEELMHYANDPFWIKLRWFLFIGFWALWVGMLVGAIFIIVQTPKCLPPEPHTWYKQGPLVSFDVVGEPSEETLKTLKDHGVTGVIYKLPADETYSLKNVADIKRIVEAFKKSEVNVVLDVTATYVLENDELFKEALLNQSALDAFVYTRGTPPNWVSFENTPAFKEVEPGLNVLSQYGNGRYDLRMENEIVKAKLKAVLKELVEKTGIQGVRFDKSKHFIIDTELADESPNRDVNDRASTDYLFWTHARTSLRDGLGELLAEYRDYFHNITDDGFLSTVDDIVRPEVYQHKGGLGVDIPHFGRLNYLLGQEPINVGELQRELEDNDNRIRGLNSWVQYPYSQADFTTLDASEYTIFTFLLPGVPVTTLSALKYGNSSKSVVLELEKTRESPSCMHGSFDIYVDDSNQSIGYTRHKSGNPGFFVVLNPTSGHVVANFTHVESMSPELKVHLLSDNFKSNSTLKIKDKVKAEALNLPPKSAGIFTYVAAN